MWREEQKWRISWAATLNYTVWQLRRKGRTIRLLWGRVGLCFRWLFFFQILSLVENFFCTDRCLINFFFTKISGRPFFLIFCKSNRYHSCRHAMWHILCQVNLKKTPLLKLRIDGLPYLFWFCNFSDFRYILQLRWYSPESREINGKLCCSIKSIWMGFTVVSPPLFCALPRFWWTASGMARAHL